MLWDCIFRLLLAGVLGGVIGWDREYRAKEAGLRTHFLVALGSALIMIVSQYGFADVLAKPGYGLDPSRVAAQWYRFYRSRDYSDSKTVCTRLNDGCRFMGDFGYRTGCRRRYVLDRSIRHDSDFNRT